MKNPRNGLLFTTRGVYTTTFFTKFLSTAFIHGGVSFFCNSTTFWRTGLFWTFFFSSCYSSFLCSSTSIFSFLVHLAWPPWLQNVTCMRNVGTTFSSSLPQRNRWQILPHRGHEQKFKYSYPRDSKIIQMPDPRAKAIDQYPALCPASPLPPPHPPWKCSWKCSTAYLWMFTHKSFIQRSYNYIKLSQSLTLAVKGLKLKYHLYSHLKLK